MNTVINISNGRWQALLTFWTMNISIIMSVKKIMNFACTKSWLKNNLYLCFCRNGSVIVISTLIAFLALHVVVYATPWQNIYIMYIVKLFRIRLYVCSTVFPTKVIETPIHRSRVWLCKTSPHCDENVIYQILYNCRVFYKG